MKITTRMSRIAQDKRIEPATATTTMTLRLNNQISSSADRLIGRGGEAGSPEMLLDGLLNLCAPDTTDQAPFLLTLPEKNQRGDAADTVTGRDCLILLDIELSEQNLSPFIRERVDGGSNDPAGSAPGCPEIDNDRPTSQNRVKIRIGENERSALPVERCLARTATDGFPGGGFRYAVGSATFRAGKDRCDAHARFAAKVTPERRGAEIEN